MSNFSPLSVSIIRQAKIQCSFIVQTWPIGVTFATSLECRNGYSIFFRYSTQHIIPSCISSMDTLKYYFLKTIQTFISYYKLLNLKKKKKLFTGLNSRTSARAKPKIAIRLPVIDHWILPQIPVLCTLSVKFGLRFVFCCQRGLLALESTPPSMLYLEWLWTPLFPLWRIYYALRRGKRMVSYPLPSI